jgi:hypothetical protein
MEKQISGYVLRSNADLGAGVVKEEVTDFS